MNDERLIKLQHFFESDVRIKKAMYNMAPTTLQYFDEDSMSKYTNDVYDTLLYIFSELKSIALDLFGKESKVLERVCYIEKETKEAFYACGYDINKLKLFYSKCISNMESNFIDSVKKECVGYTGGGIRSVDLAFTVNEILHFIHSFIVNNDYILQSIPLVDVKNNKRNYPISYRGIDVPEFRDLFKKIPFDLDIAWTEMVAINEKKIIMMVRDRGHALSIEITLNRDIARVEYFVPKLINIEMINNLPGINKVNRDSVGATGAFEVSIDKLPDSLFDFISKVPTDDDMVFYETMKM